MTAKSKKFAADEQAEGVRINKYLADAGVCSRRVADQYIEEGKVFIDGERAVSGDRVLPGQKVVFNGKEITKEEQLVLLALNKPRGIVCTSDTREPDNVVEFVNYGKRIYPIGRLDKDSEGLLLLTNDGDIVNKILRAGNYHEKEYIVKVNKMLTKDFLQGMASGVPILDTVTRPCRIEALDKYRFRIILTQGLNRQIRRMCEYFGYRVVHLQRIRIMNITLGHLKVGDYRKLTPQELDGLKKLIQNSSNTPVLHDPTRTQASVTYAQPKTVQPTEERKAAEAEKRSTSDAERFAERRIPDRRQADRKPDERSFADRKLEGRHTIDRRMPERTSEDRKTMNGRTSKVSDVRKPVDRMQERSDRQYSGNRSMPDRGSIRKGSWSERADRKGGSYGKA